MRMVKTLTQTRLGRRRRWQRRDKLAMLLRRFPAQQALGLRPAQQSFRWAYMVDVLWVFFMVFLKDRNSK